MSRSGYVDEIDDQWASIRWRGAVASAIRGKRGQSFLREMLEALDALPVKALIAEELEYDGQVCALGSVGLKRGVDMSALDVEDYYGVAEAFGIPNSLAREIEYINDEESNWHEEATPEQRFQHVRKWVVSQIKEAA